MPQVLRTHGMDGTLRSRASLPKPRIPLPRREPASKLSHPPTIWRGRSSGISWSQYLLCWISQALISAHPRRHRAVIPSRWGHLPGRLLVQVAMDKESAKRAGRKVSP